MPPSRFQSKIAELRRERNALVAHVAVLQNKTHKGTRLSNNMSELASALGGSFFQQSNLTSMNPMIQNNIYFPITLDWFNLTYMYKTHGVIQTAIEMPVLDALRGGIEIKSNQLDANDIKELLDFFEDKDLFQMIVETATWARLFGGAGLIVNIMDQDPAKPLKPRKSSADIQFYAANRWEFGQGYRATTREELGLMPAQNFTARFADTYEFYGKTVDRSHVFDIAGKAPPSLIRWQLQGWGMAEIERMVEDFNAYIKTKNVLYELLNEAKLDVYGIEGLNDSLMSQDGTAKIVNRVQKANQIKAFNNALIIDRLDEFQQKQITFNGLADVMRENRIGIASALRMPFSKLFGTTAGGGGLANSGQDDLENYNAMVESEVRQRLRPIVRKLMKLVCIHLFGNEYDVDFSFKPLRVLSEVEEEQVKTSKQARIVALKSVGILSVQEAANELAKEKLIPTETLASQGLMKEQPEDIEGEGLIEQDDSVEEDSREEKNRESKGGKAKNFSPPPPPPPPQQIIMPAPPAPTNITLTPNVIMNQPKPPRLLRTEKTVVRDGTGKVVGMTETPVYEEEK